MNGYNNSVNGAQHPMHASQVDTRLPAYARQNSLGMNAVNSGLPQQYMSSPAQAFANVTAPSNAMAQQQQQQLMGMRSKQSSSQPHQPHVQQQQPTAHPQPPPHPHRQGPPRPITEPADGGPPYKVPVHPIFTRMSYMEPGEQFPSLTPAEQLKVKGWMERDSQYEQDLFASRKAQRQELMMLHQDWIKREDWLGMPDQPPPPKFALRFPTDRQREQAKGKRGNIRQQLKLSKQVAALAAETRENLIPVRIDCENEAYKIRETFTWNLNETTITPEIFASHLIEDLRVPYNPFFREVVAQIRRHIEDAQLTESYTTHLAPDEAEIREQARNWFLQQSEASDPAFAVLHDEDDNVLPAPEGPDRELRIVIRLDITQDNVQLVDKFEWDVSNPSNSPEDFAETYTADLGLSGEFKTAVAHAIREQLDVYVRSLCIIGYTPGTSIADEELRREFLPHVIDIVREQPADFTPLINYLTPEELERNDREREREVRRKRRQTKGRGTTLPERDRPKTHRSVVPKNSTDPIQPTIDARGDTVWPQPEIQFAYPIQSVSLAPKPLDLHSPADSPLRLTVAKPQLSQPAYEGLLGFSTLNGRPTKRLRQGLSGTFSGIVSPTGIMSPINSPGGTPGVDPLLGRQGFRKRGGKHGLHDTNVNGKWHCANCGIPDFMSTGRRKGPTGSNTLCGLCGKYYNRYKRNRPVEYSTDPDHHQRLNTEFAMAAAAAGVQNSADARLEEEHNRARLLGQMRPKPVIQDSEDDSDESQDSAMLAKARKVRGQTPDLPFVDVGSGSESSASESGPPTPRRPGTAAGSVARPAQQQPSAVPAAASPTKPAAAPQPAPEPEPWMTDAAHELRSKQIDDRFEIIPRSRLVEGIATTEWRIRCLDCPGKLYNLGPGKTLDNFAIHFRNKQHRANVDARIGRVRAPPAAAATEASSSTPAVSSQADAGPPSLAVMPSHENPPTAQQQSPIE
ncbi:SWI/SNF chromatin-remodeling complex subunit [Microbotryomycetes sp. JL221]|nr:SWI/SNF chromatin-remodeling complex subunit [Microbotryomycetes sp. JL221]